MKKSLISEILSLVICLTATFSMQNQAQAIAIVMANQGSELSAVPVLFGMVVMVINPFIGLTMVLDNPSKTVGDLSAVITNKYGASPEESKNLAVFFVNAHMIEKHTGKEPVLTEEQMRLLAPTFYKTAGFSQMIKDFTTQPQ